MSLSDITREMLTDDFPGVSSVVFSAVTTKALLSRKYIESESMAGMVSVLSIPEDSSALVTIGEQITVEGGSYNVAEIQPDGAGMADIILEAN